MSNISQSQNTTNLSSYCYDINVACDYIPFVSTVKSTIEIFQKYLINPLLGENFVNSNRYFFEIKNKSIFRMVTLLIPFGGNFCILFYDIYQRNYKIALKNTTDLIENSNSKKNIIEENIAKTACDNLDLYVECNQSQSIIFNSKAKIYQSVNDIRLAYRKFKDTKDLNLLPEAMEGLRVLKEVESQLWNSNSNEKALEFQKIVEPFKKMVQEINFCSPTLTYQDLRNLGSFYLPPIEKLFRGEKDDITYINPDASAITRYGLRILSETGMYKGHGVGKQLFGPHPLTKIDQYYDEFYVIKTDLRHDEDALAAAQKLGMNYTSNMNFFDRLLKSPTTREDLKKLENVKKKAYEYFNENYANWGYDTFTMLGTFELLSEGMALKHAARCDVVRFYYKQHLQ